MGSASGSGGDRGTRHSPGAWNDLARYSGHGLTIAASTALFAWLGSWLDGRLGTRPLFVLLGVFVGFGAAFYSMYRHLASGRKSGSGSGSEPEGRS